MPEKDESAKKSAERMPAAEKKAAVISPNSTPTWFSIPPGDTKTRTPTTPMQTPIHVDGGDRLRRSWKTITENNGVIAQSTATIPDGMRDWADTALTFPTVVSSASSPIRATLRRSTRGQRLLLASSTAARNAAPMKARHIASPTGEKAARATSVTA